MNPYTASISSNIPEPERIPTPGVGVFVASVGLAQFFFGLFSWCAEFARVPEMVKVYSSLGSRLPLATTVLMKISDLSIQFPWIAIPVVLGTVVLVIWKFLSARGPAFFRWGAVVYAAGSLLFILGGMAETALDAPLLDLADALIR